MSTNSKTKITKQNLHTEVLKVIKSKAEIKSFDAGFGTTVDNAGSITKLSTIPQGDTDSSRQGDQCELIKLEVHANYANSSADLFNTYRHIIFRWCQDDTVAAPIVSDILQSTTVFSPLNRDNFRAKKFIVIHDVFKCTSLNGEHAKTDVFVKKLNFKILFQSGATTGTNHIYSLQLSDSAAIPHPIVSYVARVHYNDI
jgi:hypothetical protein